MKKLLFSSILYLSLTACQVVKHKEILDTAKVFSTNDISKEKIKNLDIIYQSAVNSDTSLAVFKSEEDQQKLVNAYTTFVSDFGKFLNQNKFTWDQETKCWNRLYFNENGNVDYYIYNFKSPIEKSKEDSFKLLFSKYIITHKINLTSNKKFSQCSPVTFENK